MQAFHQRWRTLQCAISKKGGRVACAVCCWQLIKTFAKLRSTNFSLKISFLGKAIQAHVRTTILALVFANLQSKSSKRNINILCEENVDNHKTLT